MSEKKFTPKSDLDDDILEEIAALVDKERALLKDGEERVVIVCTPDEGDSWVMSCEEEGSQALADLKATYADFYEITITDGSRRGERSRKVQTEMRKKLKARQDARVAKGEFATRAAQELAEATP